MTDALERRADRIPGRLCGDSYMALMPDVQDTEHRQPRWHEPDAHQRQHIGARYVEFSPTTGGRYICLVQWLHPHIGSRLGANTLVSLSMGATWTGAPLQDHGFLHSSYLAEKFPALHTREADWPWVGWLVAYALDRDTDMTADWAEAQREEIR